MSISDLPSWVDQPWASCLPGDNIITGDIVVDRSLLLAGSRDASKSVHFFTAQSERTSIDNPSERIQLEVLSMRLDALEASDKVEARRVRDVRRRTDNIFIERRKGNKSDGAATHARRRFKNSPLQL